MIQMLSRGCFHVGPLSSLRSITTLGYTSGSYRRSGFYTGRYGNSRVITSNNLILKITTPTCKGSTGFLQSVYYQLYFASTAAQYKNIQSIKNMKKVIHRQKSQWIIGINKRNKQRRVHHN